MTVVNPCSGQVWNTVGNGLGYQKGLQRKISSTTDGSSIYVAHNRTTASGFQVTIEKWNGLSWSRLPSVPSNDFLADDILVKGSSIYVIGTNNLTAGRALFRFDGSAWSSFVIPNYSGSAYYLDTLQGDILVGGAFSANFIGDWLIRFDGSSFQGFGQFNGPSITGLNNITRHAGDIFAGISEQQGVLTGVRKYDQGLNEWIIAAHFRQGTSSVGNDFNIFSYQSTLYAVEKGAAGKRSTLFEVDRDTLFFVGKINHRFNKFIEYNGDGYLVGDTIFGYTNTITKFDGTNLSSEHGGPLGVDDIEVFNGARYLVSHRVDSLYGFEYNHVFRSVASLPVLAGYTFLDLDKNCVKSSSEPLIPYLGLSWSGKMVSSGSLGRFTVPLPSGSHSLDSSHVFNSVHKNLVKSCAYSNPVFVGTSKLAQKDIGFTSSVAVDMQVVLTANIGFGARYGISNFYQLKVGNAGNTTKASTTVRVQVPPTLTFGQSQPSPDSIVGQNLYYTITNLFPYGTNKISINALINTSNNTLGDTLVWYANLLNVTGDFDINDNSDTLVQRVITAYDPNDKRASATKVELGTKNVDYHIRFQNTGNDTAVKVTVVDTLDLTLPTTKIVINSASHPYNFSVVGNVLIWEFENIMLPDSGADFSGSQGFIRFSAGLNPSLGVGDTIDNDAEIYFDYQPPVHTNHAKTAVVKTISLQENSLPTFLEVYPNPAWDHLYLENNGTRVVEFELVNSSGQIMAKVLTAPGERTSLEISGFRPGLYILKGGNSTYKIILK